jgi:hypothetical protein
MTPEEQETVNRMIEELKQAGKPCGYMSDGANVWIRGPGSPWADTPTPHYTSDDLRNAVAVGAVREQQMVGTPHDFTYYVLNLRKSR